MSTYALGVDLGTTVTAAAVARGTTADPLTLGTDAAAIPSVVFLRDDGEVLVGDAAERRAALEPARAAREFKRRFGDPVPKLVGGVSRPIEALMADLLREVVRRATEQEGEPPTVVVLTHPANWTEFKVDKLRDSARLAGLDPGRVQVLTEPEAAAVAYTRLRPVEVGELIAVYDFGGGTFDAAVVRRTPVGFELIGTPEGLERLGGIDVDQAVLAHVDRSLDGMVSGADRSDPRTLPAQARLRTDCRRAKEVLSADADTTVPVSMPGVHTEVRLTRVELEAMVRPRLAETVRALVRTVASSGASMESVSRVLLVGGTSRMPLVGDMVREATGRPIAVDLHPKLAIALGAALVGAASLGTSALPPPLPGLPGVAAAASAAAGTATAWQPPTRVPPPAPAAPRNGRRTLLLAGAAAAVTAAVVAGVLMLGGSGDESAERPADGGGSPATVATSPDEAPGTPVSPDPAATPASTPPASTAPVATDPGTTGAAVADPALPELLGEIPDVVAVAAAPGGAVAVTADGRLLRLDGAAGSPLATLGGPPGGVVADDDGSLLVTVGAQVLRIPAGGGAPVVFADGTGVGLGATPGPIALDDLGNAFFVDVDNRRIVRAGTDGSLNLVAGNGAAVGGAPVGDGQRASDVPIGRVVGLAIDGSGTLLIADADTRSVRAVSTDGTIRTWATGFDSVDALTVDTAGRVFVAEGASGTLFDVRADGTVTPAAAASGTDPVRSLAWDDGLVVATAAVVQRLTL
jgi:actin-like ATPase involved in cell morphogenesis